MFSITPYQFLTPIHEHMTTGGHAGLSETLNLMAFHPELVDLTQLPEGELSVRQLGILHGQPTIERSTTPPCDAQGRQRNPADARRGRGEVR